MLRMDGDVLDGVAVIVHAAFLGTESNIGRSRAGNDHGHVLDPADKGVFAPDDVFVIFEDVGEGVVGDGDAGAFGDAKVGQNVGESDTLQDQRGDLGRALCFFVFQTFLMIG